MRYAIFISGTGQYGVSQQFLQALSGALLPQQIQPLWFFIDPTQNAEQHLRRLHQLVQHKELSFCFSINGLGLDYLAAFERLAAIPCFSWLLDHPLHHLQRFRAHRDQVHLLCVDRYHTKWLQQRGFTASDFFHAVTLPQTWPAAIPPDIGLLFPASYFDENQHIAGLQAAHPKLLDILLSPDIKNIADFMQLLRQDEDSAQILPDVNTQNFLRLADLFLRGKSRNQLVQDCADAGIELVIAGHGWEHSGFAGQHILLGAVSYAELPGWIRRSQFVLHHHPGFVAGLHERLLLALSCGTPVLTPQQPFLQQQFRPQDGVYSFDNAASLLHLPLDSHLGHDISQSAALQQHTFISRARQLLSWCQAGQTTEFG